MGLLALAVAWGAGVATVSSGRSNVMACGVTVGVLVGALFVAALAGRRRPRLVLPVVLALAAWMACSPWAPGSVNARHDEQPLLASAQAPQRINGSNMTYDLTGTSLEHDTTVTLQPTASKVTVEVPAGVPLVVSYTLSGAALDVEDADDPLHVAGAARDTWRSPTTRTSGPTLALVITARASAVLVQHA